MSNAVEVSIVMADGELIPLQYPDVATIDRLNNIALFWNKTATSPEKQVFVNASRWESIRIEEVIE